jgi:hypothetical protein
LSVIAENTKLSINPEVFKRFVIPAILQAEINFRFSTASGLMDPGRKAHRDVGE